MWLCPWWLCPLTYVEPGTFISISITLGCTSIDICTFVDGYTPTLNIFSSSTSFYIAYVLTNCCYTPSSSSDSSMFTESTNVAPGLACTFELQPLLHLHKNSNAYVPILYISWIIVCANCIFSLYGLPSSHLKNDGECGDKFIAND